MAQLHRIDINGAGLSDFGRPGGYFERQVSVWSQNYTRAAQAASMLVAAGHEGVRLSLRAFVNLGSM